MGIREAHRERPGSGIGHSEKGARATPGGSNCLWTRVPGACLQLQKEEVCVELSAKSGWSLCRAWRGWKLCFNWFLLFQNLPFVLLTAPQCFLQETVVYGLPTGLHMGFGSMELSVKVLQGLAVHSWDQNPCPSGATALVRCEPKWGKVRELWSLSCGLSLSCAHLGEGGRAQAPENNPYSSSLIYLGPPFAFWNCLSSHIFFSELNS